MKMGKALQKKRKKEKNQIHKENILFADVAKKLGIHVCCGF